MTDLLEIGLLPEEQCSRGMSECRPDQDPELDRCYPADHYVRSWLYKSWDLQCDPLDMVQNTTFLYLMEFKGRFHWGSTAKFRCLPGFSIDPQYAAEVNQRY